MASLDAAGNEGDPSSLEDLMSELNMKALIQSVMESQSALQKATQAWKEADRILKRVPRPRDANAMTSAIQKALDPFTEDPTSIDGAGLERWAKETVARKAAEDKASAADTEQKVCMQAALDALDRLVSFVRDGE
jgi:hypothetical protein